MLLSGIIYSQGSIDEEMKVLKSKCEIFPLFKYT